MKNCILTFYVLIFITCDNPHERKVNVTYDNNFEILNGNVKRIVDIIYQGNTATIITDFDVHGNITQCKKTGFNGYTNKWQYKYNNETGKPVKAIENSGRWPMVECKYDKMGRIANLTYFTKELRDNSDHVLKKDSAVFKYDNSGYLIIYERFKDTERFVNKKYRYNDKHLLTEADWYSKSNIFQYKELYQYQVFDKKGNWLKRTTTPGRYDQKSDISLREVVYY